MSVDTSSETDNLRSILTDLFYDSAVEAQSGGDGCYASPKIHDLFRVSGLLQFSKTTSSAGNGVGFGRPTQCCSSGGLTKVAH